MGSVDWRATKLLAFKIGGLKKKSAIRPRPHSNRSARIRERPGSQSLMACNFAALWPTDPKFLAFKDLDPFLTVSKVQEASRILRMGFSLSKWPHLLHKMGLDDSQSHTTVIENCTSWSNSRKSCRKIEWCNFSWSSCEILKAIWRATLCGSTFKLYNLKNKMITF